MIKPRDFSLFLWLCGMVFVAVAPFSEHLGVLMYLTVLWWGAAFWIGRMK